MNIYEEERVLRIITETPGLDREAIAALARIDRSDLIPILLGLEANGKIKSTTYWYKPENWYWYKYYVA